jgi:hypothetical protein
MKSTPRFPFARASFVAAVASVLPFPSSSHAAPIPARSADAFVDSIGVCTHTGYGSTTTFSRNWDTGDPNQSIKSLLPELGIRHIRDGINYNAIGWKWDRFCDLYRATGIKAQLIMDDRTNDIPDPAFVDDLLTQFKTRSTVIGGQTISFLSTIEAVEGPNEFDINGPYVGTSNWVTPLTSYQQAIFQQVRGDSAFNTIPVVAPSMGNGNSLDLLAGMAPWLDRSNAHPYPGGVRPSLAGGIPAYRGDTSRVWPGKPLLASETGYHNALSDSSGHAPVSKKAAQKYHSRLLATHFKQNIDRTFLYQFIDLEANPSLNDREKHFGLVGVTDAALPPGSTPYTLYRKPTFYAIKNLITLLKEPGAQFTPDPLDYSLGGSTTDVQDLLLQKKSGEFYLVLWLEKDSYLNPLTTPAQALPGSDVNVPPQSVTVQFGQNVTSVIAYTPGAGTNTGNPTLGTQGTTLTISNNTVTVSVPDEIVLLKIVAQPPTLVANGELYFEAEEAFGQSQFSPFALGADITASGEKYITIPAGTGNGPTPTDTTAGQAQFSFRTTQAQDVSLWARCQAASVADDSFFVKLNGAYEVWDAVGNGTAAWVWKKFKTYNALAAGTYTLRFAHREDGPKLDQIALSSNPAFSPTLGPSQALYLEAEDAVGQACLKPATLEFSATASGQHALTVLNGVGTSTPSATSDGRAAYIFGTSQAATLYVWARVFAPTANDDSFFLQLDGGTWNTWALADNASWQWRKFGTAFSSVAAGNHTLALAWREDGTWVDQIVITTDVAFVPQ